MNDVERCANLVCDVLHELRLLFTCLACQQSGLFQFGGALFRFLLLLFYLPNVLADTAPHLAETVLQLTNQVGAFTMWQRLLIVAMTNLSQFGSQQSQRLREVFHNAVAAQSQQQQSDNEQRNQDVVQFVVSTEQFVGRTHKCNAPLGALKRSVKHNVRLAIDFDIHVSCASIGHLISQRHDVGVLSGVSTREDGLLQQLRGVRMHEIVTIGTQQHEVRVLVWMFSRDGLREPLQRQVGGDDTHELTLPVVQRDAVRSNHLRA